MPQFSLTAPTSGDDVTNATYNNGTLTFTASSDSNAKLHYVLIGPTLIQSSTGGTPAGLEGSLVLNSASVTLPQTLQDVIAAGTNWDIESFAGSAVAFGGPNAIGLAGLFESTPGSAPESAFEIAQMADFSTAAKADFYTP